MFHREFLLMASVVLLTSSAWAQGVDRSSFPQGMQVHGNAEFIGHQESASAAAWSRSMSSCAPSLTRSPCAARTPTISSPASSGIAA